MIVLNDYFQSGVDAWFTERGEGSFALPSGDEDDALDSAQKDILCREGIDAQTVVTIRQVHGAKVLVAEDLSGGGLVPEADGIVTQRTDVVLSVRTADCVPIFLYDPVRRCAGLVHGGWKSVHRKIVTETLKRLYQNFGTYPSDLKVVLGPSIRSCCYQVGQEFCEIFPEAMEPRYGQWFFDLQKVIVGHLTDFGVREERIYDVRQCTCCDSRFFSWRRDGDAAGRHLSLMKIRGV